MGACDRCSLFFCIPHLFLRILVIPAVVRSLAPLAGRGRTNTALVPQLHFAVPAGEKAKERRRRAPAFSRHGMPEFFI